MKTSVILLGIFLAIPSVALSQVTLKVNNPFKISQQNLAGEGLDFIKQKDTTRSVYQKKVYDGDELAVYIVAIGTGITNEFQNFPLEEFIFWINGKAVVEPQGEESFAIQTGDYFVQAKGFSGKWNFIDIGGHHLELALVAKNRPDSTFKSPMSRAKIIDRDVISGVERPNDGIVYRGPELSVNLLTSPEQLGQLTQERMVHILNGVLKLTYDDQREELFYPGDFLILPEGFKAAWSSNSVQNLRMFEVFKSKL